MINYVDLVEVNINERKKKKDKKKTKKRTTKLNLISTFKINKTTSNHDIFRK